ncbi:patatin-like phospholipase family protein [Roseovarius dicentrarchi]|uniref:patatin-like phospholipase family protein n=1 Tax=Roseovarius dicentrarchi TaxID=2250573 RepID=UPI0013966673|nr:patatin-like phospholipase family protein [Roseovarius dicentrarchi]
MKTLALVLGAGGARGIAHIHALKAFDDLGLKPSMISGTSIGALIGAAYAAGMSGADIQTYVQDSFNDRARLITQALKVRPSSVKSFFADGGLRLGEFNLETVLSVFLPPVIPATFEELQIPFHAVATDFYAEKSTVFSAGPLHRPLAASAAIPAVFLPVRIGDAYYIDGSATNPCPLDTVQRRADEVIAIDVSGGTKDGVLTRPTKMDVIYASSQMMQQSIVALSAREFPRTALIRPSVGTYRALDFLKVSDILEETADLRDEVKTAIDRLLTRPPG